MTELTNSTNPPDPTVPQTLFNVRGLTAVITGGSGVLGSVMALALAKAGVRVAILSLHAASSAKVVEAIQAAVANFTQWLAVHMAREYRSQIRVNAIAPGFILTEQNRFLLTDAQS